jgi:hypothetical protein
MKLPLGLTVGLGFAPYIVFSLFARAGSSNFGLWAALIAAIAIVLINRASKKPPRLLEIGALALFAALTAFSTVTTWAWTFMTLRLVVDCGLFFIIIGSLVVSQPFTIQYARERVPESVQRSPRFLMVNTRITAAWAAAFMILIAAHTANLAGGLSVGGDLVVTIAPLSAAVFFSIRYPAYVRKASGPEAEAL